MVRGCQKKIIYLKNTGSDVFDEAYFIMSDKCPEVSGECDMIKEANRILGECSTIKEKRRIFTRIFIALKDKIAILLTGIIIGIVSAILMT